VRRGRVSCEGWEVGDVGRYWMCAGDLVRFDRVVCGVVVGLNVGRKWKRGGAGRRGRGVG